jgi:hypothetical protein
MSHVKTILFLITALAVGIGLGKGYLYWKQHNDHDFTHVGDKPLVTGVGNAPDSRGFAIDDLSALPRVLEETAKAFGTTVGIEYAPGMTREAMIKAAADVHAKGLEVVLLPPPVFASGNPYGKPLTQVAADARDAQVDYFCISWVNERTDSAFWLREAAEIRKSYSGKIIFAATPTILTGIECWDACDLLGAIGPISIPQRLPRDSENVDEHALRVAWDSTLSGLESLAKAHDKKLALLHMNIPARVSAKISDSSAPPAANPTLQRLIYDALLLETKGRAAQTQVMLFRWGSSGQEEAPNHLPKMLQRIGQAWEPKEPREIVPTPAPATAPVAETESQSRKL